MKVIIIFKLLQVELQQLLMDKVHIQLVQVFQF